MRIHLAFVVVILTLFTGHSARATQWEVVASPNVGRQANSLSSVAALADNDVWAVGWAWNQQLNAYQTEIQHWNGTNWSLVRSPNATNGYNFLNGVGVVAANDVWAVGQAATGSTYQTLVEHWNGTAWSIVSSPNVPGFSNTLQAVSVISANDIWAVGYSTDTNFNNFTLTLHWNGTAWSIVPSPIVNDDLLFGVDAVASNDVWAVGRSQQEAVTLIIHWDGSNWSVVPSPNDGFEDNILFGIAAIASNDVWAVGSACCEAPLALHWDGASWNIVPTPIFDPDATNPVFVGIVALSSNNIWTAGQYIVPIQGSAQFTLTENWNGSQWNSVQSPNKRNSNNRLHGITATPNGTLWAVGTTGVFARPERTFILRKTP
jgi:hypothetical protein